MTGVIRADPVVIVTSVHVPLGVTLSAATVVLGIAAMLFCSRRFQRVSAYRWIVLLISLGGIVFIAAAVVVTSIARTVTGP